MEKNLKTKQKLVEQQQIKEEVVHLPTTPDQEKIYNLANKHLELLKHALDNAIAAEKHCFEIYMKNNPGEEPGNCLWRIQETLKPILEEIKRCEPIDGKKASKMPQYKSKPKVRLLTDKLEQQRKLI